MLASVLILDDRPLEYAEGLADALRRRGLDALAMHPSDVQIADLEAACVVLVDYKLEDWTSRDQLTEPALMPSDGIALAAVLRRRVSDRPVFFALISGSVADAFNGVSPRNRRHQLARVESLEWVFAKDDADLELQLQALAEAAKLLKLHGPVASTTLNAALKIPDDPASVREVAVTDVRRCIPPLGDLEALTSGVAFVRWMLQRALPYPTFLIDGLQIAARLGITAACVEKLAASSSRIGRLLQSYEYRGMLTGFQGPRWWKAGVDEVTWQLSDQGKRTKAEQHQQLAMELGWNVDALTLNDPVVVVDEDLLPTGELRERASCVRLLPDDWPAYADPAYCELQLVKESAPLLALVHPDDQWLLTEDEIR